MAGDFSEIKFVLVYNYHHKTLLRGYFSFPKLFIDWENIVLHIVLYIFILSRSTMMEKRKLMFY